MLHYQITNAQEKHFYACFPEVVIYDIQTKKTVLLSSFAARIVRRFTLNCTNAPISEAEMKEHCSQADGFFVEVFEQSLEQLLQMKIIELVQ